MNIQNSNPKNTPTLFIFAGEKSGDLHGSHLIRALKLKNPEMRLFGVGGPAMRELGMDTVLNMEDFEVMGFTDVMKSLPKLRRHFFRVRDHVLASSPGIVILIDYPGFNLRLAKALRKMGFKGKIVHYISPTVWAHGSQRVRQMAATLDLLLLILPFETQYYAGSGLKAVYVGNPLQEYIQSHQYNEEWKKQAGMAGSGPVVSLFPGSRLGEIQRNLPAMLEAASMLKNEHKDVRFAISCAHHQAQSVALQMLLKTSLKINQDVFFADKTCAYEMMRDSRCAVAKSGTITLELALHGCPTVVVYKLTLLNRIFAKFVLGLKLPYYSLANILAGQAVFPELIEYGFSAKNIYARLKSLFEETPERKSCLEGCNRIKALLNENQSSRESASRAAAIQIEELLSC